MRARELFKTTGFTQSISGTAIPLDRENCQIVKKTKKENSIVLCLKRESDGKEGRAHLKIQNKFETLSDQLLNWAFISESIVGLTLNQLDDLETNLSVESIGGKLQLKK